MLPKEELLLIIYFTAISLLLLTFVVVFFIAFQRRKKKLIIAKYEAQRKYEKEFAKSKLEIQEETLKMVGRELHDNIGQLLSVINMQLSILEETTDDSTKQNMGSIREVVRNTIQEVRALSKSLNNESIDQFGLTKSVESEVNRLNRMSHIQFRYFKTGEEKAMNQKDSIIIFRIVQEFINNVIKHSEAKILDIQFDFTPKNLIINMKDDGVGFEMEKMQQSSGMINMSSRAKLLGAKFNIFSEIKKGSSLKLIYPMHANQ